MKVQFQMQLKPETSLSEDTMQEEKDIWYT